MTIPPFVHGIRDCFAAPGWGILASMTGFGTIAADLGEPLWRTLALTIGIWSMTGQLAFVQLTAENAASWTIVLAVTVANLRLLPLTLATIPLIRLQQGHSPHHLWIAQINSVTAFVQLLHVRRSFDDRRALHFYFLGFAITCLLFGIAGTTLGHTAAATLPAEVIRTLVFTTPLYILLLSGRTPDGTLFNAALLGCVIVPLASEWNSDWGIIVGGVAAGTLAFALGERRRPR